MKVKFVDFEASIIDFASKLIGTMPTTAHKFIAGLVLARFAGRIEKTLGVLADADGNVDTCELRNMVDAGFKESGDNVSITLGDDSTKLIFKPITVSVTRSDVESVISGMESVLNQS